MVFSYTSICESRSFHDTLDGDQDRFNGLGAGDNEVITESLALETETQIRRRLDSFYSATSRRSTYYSAGAVSSYQSFNDSQGTDLGSSSAMISTEFPLPTLFHVLRDSIFSRQRRGRDPRRVRPCFQPSSADCGATFDVDSDRRFAF